MKPKPFYQVSLLVVVHFFLAGHVFATPCTQPSGDGTTWNGGIFDAGGTTPAFSACEDGITGSQTDSETILNTNLFFGLWTWEQLSKLENPEGVAVGGSIDLTVKAFATVSDPDPANGSGIGALDGTWSFSPDVWSTYENIVIVMKGSTYWSAYLLIPEIFRGTWDFSNTLHQELSHFSVYGAQAGAPVPEPATLLLLGTGLAVLAGLARRRVG